MADTAVLDVDGTLVDTNFHHAIAWFRAFRDLGLTVPVWRLHRATGMGGDMLVGHVTDEDVEREHGDDLRAAWTQRFDELIGEVQPFEHATDLLRELKRRGFSVVLASSGQAQHVDAFLDLLGARDVADGWTTSADVERSKPAPDLVATALDRVGGHSGVLVGDSPWDCVAGDGAGVPTIGVLTGGFSEAELREAGAVDVHRSPGDLLRALDRTALSVPS